MNLETISNSLTTSTQPNATTISTILVDAFGCVAIDTTITTINDIISTTTSTIYATTTAPATDDDDYDSMATKNDPNRARDACVSSFLVFFCYFFLLY
jgi:hypothetical protein